MCVDFCGGQVVFGSPKSTPAIEINVCWQIRARSIGQQCFISLLERRQFDKLVYRVEYSEPLFSSVRQECSLSNGRGCLLPACVASLVLFFGSFYSARLSRSSVGGVQFTVPHHCTRNSSQLFSLLFSLFPLLSSPSSSATSSCRYLLKIMTVVFVALG